MNLCLGFHQPPSATRREGTGARNTWTGDGTRPRKTSASAPRSSLPGQFGILCQISANPKFGGGVIMPVGFDQPLYVLPFDHRGSFQTKMFGWKGELNEQQTAEIAAAKQ